jgi:hypothetical protein
MKKRAFIAAFLVAVAGWFSATEVANAQVVSTDPNFTPSVLAPNLSAPAGLAFRAPSGDLVLAQTGANQVSMVKISNGSVKALASQTSPYEVSVRSSDGLTAVTMQSANRTNDQIDFYNSSGTLVGTISAQTSFGVDNAQNCLSGSAFDSSGNFYVAAATNFEGCGNWSLYEFVGPMPYSVSGNFVTNFNEGDVIEGVAFNPTPLPNGSFYAVSSSNGKIYQVIPCGGDCQSLFLAGSLAVSQPQPPGPLSSVAVDPLLGDVYVTAGTQVLRMQPPQPAGNDGGPVGLTIFANNFTNTFGISFDINGNLYVNDTTAGNLWEFARNAFATAIVPIVQGQLITFTNPNPLMSDQTQSIFIPFSALLGTARYMNVVFVPALDAQLDARLALGSTGDRNFFGGGPIPAGSTCVPVPSAGNNNHNCLVEVQKCYDINFIQQDVCTIQEPGSSPDLILLTTSYTGPANTPPAHLGIDFDMPSSFNTATDINIQPLDCCTGKGGTKGLCSQTYFFVPGTGSTPLDFSIAVNPNSISLPPNPGQVGVQLASLPASASGFQGSVNLTVANVPPGISAVLTNSTLPLTSGGTNSTTLNVSVVAASFGTTPTTTSMATLIANLVASGCIDNPGIAKALTSKLAAAQASINAGQLATAANTLTAFKNQVSAQTGKHIGTSCTMAFTLLVNGTSPDLNILHSAAVNVSVTGFNAASALSAAATSLITLLTGVPNGDPITGFVLSGAQGQAGATLAIYHGANKVLTSSPSDVTGFYYFSNTNLLTKGTTYKIQILGFPVGFGNSSPAFVNFTWNGKGLAFNFMVY